MKRLFLIFLFVSYLFFPVWTLASDLTDWLSPEQEASQLFLDGYVDVQWFEGYGGAGNHVDPTGVEDSTIALQACITLVEAQFVNGTLGYTILFSNQSDTVAAIYKISDTLNCWQEGKWVYTVSPAHQFVRQITTGGARPTIKLAASSTGFDDANDPKPMLWSWKNGNTSLIANAHLNDSDQNFDVLFRGIDLDLGGATNPGAVGISFRTAQGAQLEDIKITATGSLAGIGALSAYGTMHTNIEIIGGSYAVINSVCPDSGFPDGYLYCPSSNYGFHFEFAGSKFTDQTVAVFRYGARQYDYMMLVGCHVSNSGSIPFNSGLPSSVSSAGILLDKCKIEMGSDTTLLQSSWDHNVVIRDTYTKGIDEIVAGGTAISDTTNYTHIKEYRDIGGSGSRFKNLINGTMGTSDNFDKVEGLGYTQEQLIAALITPTKWASTFPRYDDADVINATLIHDTDAGYTNVSTTWGDGSCTADLQAAIEYCETNNKTLFLPRGWYRIGTPGIEVQADSKIIGAGINSTVLLADSAWEPSTETVIVTVGEGDAGDEAGTAIIADLSVRHFASTAVYNPTHKNFVPIEWKVGEDSQARDILSGTYFSGYISESGHRWVHSMIKVNGYGGGRWWNVFSRGRNRGGDDPEDYLDKYTYNESSRPLLIEDTNSNMWIYGYNHVGAGVNIEIDNSDNKTIYNADQENNRTLIRITDSLNFKYMGMRSNSGNTLDTETRGSIEAIGAGNLFVAGIQLNASSGSYNTVREVYLGSTNVIGTEYWDVCVFKRGTLTYTNISNRKIIVVN